MPTVKFTYALRRFFPQLEATPTDRTNLPDVLAAIDQRYPGLQSYITDERGALRKHVNIFVDGELIRDRQHLSDTVRPKSEIFIMQALSGG